MTAEPNPALIMLLATVAGWLMMQAGLAKNALEMRRKRPACPSCGRHDSCSCSA
jgi:hypothetical protein